MSVMNNPYFILKDDRLSPVVEVEPDGEKYDLPMIEGPMLQELADAATKKNSERRYHQRFQLNKDAFALIRSISAGPLKIKGNSMGSIACEVFNAHPAKLGAIDNISMGGLIFHYVDINTPAGEALVLDILLADCGFYLANVAYKTIADVVIPEDGPGDFIKMRQLRLQFQKMNANHQAKLKDLIMSHGNEIGALGVNQ